MVQVQLGLKDQIQFLASLHQKAVEGEVLIVAILLLLVDQEVVVNLILEQGQQELLGKDFRVVMGHSITLAVAVAVAVVELLGLVPTQLLAHLVVLGMVGPGFKITLMEIIIIGAGAAEAGQYRQEV